MYCRNTRPAWLSEIVKLREHIRTIDFPGTEQACERSIQLSMCLLKHHWQKCNEGIGVYFSPGATSPNGPGPPHNRGFTITLRPTTLCRTPLDVWSARPLPDDTQHSRKTSMSPSEFEPTIPASEQPQTHALDRADTGIGCKWKCSSTNSLTLALGGGVWFGIAHSV